MSLVGQLYGAVEFPRFAKDHCSNVQPSSKKPNAEAYASWEKRNEPILAKAREQFARANKRLKQEGVGKQHDLEQHRRGITIHSR
jgi:hypothetical protein